MSDFRFRQVHLDFHTSEKIAGIGSAFDKKEWQDTLKLGHVDSITVFAKCHHGWAYYPSEVNEIHPNLSFDLLGAQLEACKEINVKAPVYISAGFDEKDAVAHPEWHQRGLDNYDKPIDFSHPGYHCLCFNTPYLEKLLAEIDEVMRLYNPCEIFLDIVGERSCWCPKCLADMTALGIDYNDERKAAAFGKRVYRNYLDRVEKVVHARNPETVIFQNSGHVTMGRPDLIDTMAHLELESLPTGGWGYDHFPMTGSYARTQRDDFLGMTGKFHGTWGEFGGFKHPNALRYESSLSLAMGGGCSIGDQMHPNGKLNPATYGLIGKAYREVEEKEPWCKGAKNIAEIAVLGVEALTGEPRMDNDFGVNRILLEKGRLYNFIDKYADFSAYKLLILPDRCAITDPELKAKIQKFVADGGKLMLSGISGLDENNEFIVNTGVKFKGESEFGQTYFIPAFETVNGVTEYLMRENAYDIGVEDGEVIAYRQNPYFNRTAEHFCSHQHAPNNPDVTLPAAVINGNVAYVGWDVFYGYAKFGDFHHKELVSYVLDRLMGGYEIEAGLPDRGIVSMTQLGDSRIVHLLFAHTSKRGENTEVIEDIVPLYNVPVSVKCASEPGSVMLQPEGVSLRFEYKDGRVNFTVPRVYIYAMIEIK